MWHNIRGKRTVRYRSISFQSTVQCQHSHLIANRRNVVNCRINFQYKTSIWFQELTKYQQHEQKITSKKHRKPEGFTVHKIQTHFRSKNYRLWLGWQRPLQQYGRRESWLAHNAVSSKFTGTSPYETVLKWCSERSKYCTKHCWLGANPFCWHVMWVPFVTRVLHVLGVLMVKVEKRKQPINMKIHKY